MKVSVAEAKNTLPKLIKAVEDAVIKWKFASGSAETKELIELKFDGVQ